MDSSTATSKYAQSAYRKINVAFDNLHAAWLLLEHVDSKLEAKMHKVLDQLWSITSELERQVDE